MSIAETLAPLIILISLGAALSRIRFLGSGFMADLNTLVFWVVMPALLFRSAAHATSTDSQTWLLVAVLLSTTIVIATIAWILSPLIGVPVTGRGTLVQGAFRGNLAFIGIPVIASTFPETAGSAPNPGLTTAVIAMTLTMAFYNALAVIVLQASRTGAARPDRLALVRSVASNPLMVSGLLGLLWAFTAPPLPSFIDRTLDTLGSAAVPIALLCIGGSLVTARLDGRRSWIACAALMKVMAVPTVAFTLSRLVGLAPVEHRIAIVFASCPTAAAAYIMARQMDGDEALASGSIAMSTILSLFSLTAALWITR